MKDIAKLRVDKITSEDIQQAINSLSQTLSPKTIRNACALATSSIKAIKPDADFKTILPQQIKTKYNDAEDEDIQKLTKAAEGRRVQMAIVIAALTGMSRSEIAALKLEDIDAENECIHVRRAMVHSEF
jgi:integrase